MDEQFEPWLFQLFNDKMKDRGMLKTMYTDKPAWTFAVYIHNKWNSADSPDKIKELEDRVTEVYNAWVAHKKMTLLPEERALSDGLNQAELAFIELSKVLSTGLKLYSVTFADKSNQLEYRHLLRYLVIESFRLDNSASKGLVDIRKYFILGHSLFGIRKKILKTTPEHARVSLLLVQALKNTPDKTKNALIQFWDEMNDVVSRENKKVSYASTQKTIEKQRSATSSVAIKQRSVAAKQRAVKEFETGKSKTENINSSYGNRESDDDDDEEEHEDEEEENENEKSDFIAPDEEVEKELKQQASSITNTKRFEYEQYHQSAIKAVEDVKERTKKEKTKFEEKEFPDQFVIDGVLMTKKKKYSSNSILAQSAKDGSFYFVQKMHPNERSFFNSLQSLKASLGLARGYWYDDHALYKVKDKSEEAVAVGNFTDKAKIGQEAAIQIWKLLVVRAVTGVYSTVIEDFRCHSNSRVVHSVNERLAPIANKRLKFDSANLNKTISDVLWTKLPPVEIIRQLHSFMNCTRALFPVSTDELFNNAMTISQWIDDPEEVKSKGTYTFMLFLCSCVIKQEEKTQNYLQTCANVLKQVFAKRIAPVKSNKRHWHAVALELQKKLNLHGSAANALVDDLKQYFAGVVKKLKDYEPTFHHFKDYDTVNVPFTGTCSDFCGSFDENAYCSFVGVSPVSMQRLEEKITISANKRIAFYCKNYVVLRQYLDDSFRFQLAGFDRYALVLYASHISLDETLGREGIIYEDVLKLKLDTEDYVDEDELNAAAEPKRQRDSNDEPPEASTPIEKKQKVEKPSKKRPKKKPEDSDTKKDEVEPKKKKKAKKNAPKELDEPEVPDMFPVAETVLLRSGRKTNKVNYVEAAKQILAEEDVYKLLGMTNPDDDSGPDVEYKEENSEEEGEEDKEDDDIDIGDDGTDEIKPIEKNVKIGEEELDKLLYLKSNDDLNKTLKKIENVQKLINSPDPRTEEESSKLTEKLLFLQEQLKIDTDAAKLERDEIFAQSRAVIEFFDEKGHRNRVTENLINVMPRKGESFPGNVITFLRFVVFDTSKAQLYLNLREHWERCVWVVCTSVHRKVFRPLFVYYMIILMNCMQNLMDRLFEHSPKSVFEVVYDEGDEKRKPVTENEFVPFYRFEEADFALQIPEGEWTLLVCELAVTEITQHVCNISEFFDPTHSLWKMFNSVVSKVDNFEYVTLKNEYELILGACVNVYESMTGWAKIAIGHKKKKLLGKDKVVDMFLLTNPYTAEFIGDITNAGYNDIRQFAKIVPAKETAKQWIEVVERGLSYVLDFCYIADTLPKDVLNVNIPINFRRMKNSYIENAIESCIEASSGVDTSKSVYLFEFEEKQIEFEDYVLKYIQTEDIDVMGENAEEDKIGDDDHVEPVEEHLKMQHVLESYHKKLQKMLKAKDFVRVADEKMDECVKGKVLYAQIKELKKKKINQIKDSNNQGIALGKEIQSALQVVKDCSVELPFTYFNGFENCKEYMQAKIAEDFLLMYLKNLCAAFLAAPNWATKKWKIAWAMMTSNTNKQFLVSAFFPDTRLLSKNNIQGQGSVNTDLLMRIFKDENPVFTDSDWAKIAFKEFAQNFGFHPIYSDNIKACKRSLKSEVAIELVHQSKTNHSVFDKWPTFFRNFTKMEWPLQFQYPVSEKGGLISAKLVLLTYLSILTWKRDRIETLTDDFFSENGYVANLKQTGNFRAYYDALESKFTVGKGKASTDEKENEETPEGVTVVPLNAEVQTMFKPVETTVDSRAVIDLTTGEEEDAKVLPSNSSFVRSIGVPVADETKNENDRFMQTHGVSKLAYNALSEENETLYDELVDYILSMNKNFQLVSCNGEFSFQYWEGKVPIYTGHVVGGLAIGAVPSVQIDHTKPILLPVRFQFHFFLFTNVNPSNLKLSPSHIYYMDSLGTWENTKKFTNMHGKTITAYLEEVFGKTRRVVFVQSAQQRDVVKCAAYAIANGVQLQLGLALNSDYNPDKLYSHIKNIIDTKRVTAFE